MPVEVRELSFKADINNGNEDEAGNNNTTTTIGDADCGDGGNEAGGESAAGATAAAHESDSPLVKICVEKVLQILESRRER